MTKEAGKHIGQGIAWLGFWLFLGFGVADFDVVISTGETTTFQKNMEALGITKSVKP